MDQTMTDRFVDGGEDGEEAIDGLDTAIEAVIGTVPECTERQGAERELMVGVLDGKIAVVTGASSRVRARASSGAFVDEGATVVHAGPGQASGSSEVAEGLGAAAIPIATDVGDPDSVRAAFDEVDASGSASSTCWSTTPPSTGPARSSS